MLQDRALKLLADIAQGRIVQSLAAEGGLQSTLWAGPEAFSRAMKEGSQPVQGLVRKNPISLKLGFSGKDYGYAIDLGLPSSGSSRFSSDPQIKAESLWTGERLGRANAFALRNGPSVRIRDDNGEWRQAHQNLAPFDSIIAAIRARRSNSWCCASGCGTGDSTITCEPTPMHRRASRRVGQFGRVRPHTSYTGRYRPCR